MKGDERTERERREGEEGRRELESERGSEGGGGGGGRAEGGVKNPKSPILTPCSFERKRLSGLRSKWRKFALCMHAKPVISPWDTYTHTEVLLRL